MTNFEETGLSSEVLNAITELGFEKPTPIQAQTIPFLLSSKKDLIALAQTGTGKTAAFGLPLVELTDTTTKTTQTLILCPTRELCLQIASDIQNFAKFKRGLNIAAVYGGASIDTQIRDLKRGAQIVVGTPGRVADLIRRNRLDISGIKWSVLDEADEMLNMGFKEELDAILEQTPSEKQTLLFSATMPKEIQRIINNNMSDPEQITVGEKNKGSEDVTHEFYAVHARDRYPALKRIVDVNPQVYGLVFCRTRSETKEVANKLINDGYSADALHGDLSQAQRDHVMQRFRQKHLQLLVATDVAARGIDVNELTHVINYNLPDELEAYIHRSGRTGRAGKKGTSIAIIHTRESGKIRELEKKIGKQFERKLVPTGDEICEKQLYNLVDKIENIEVDEDQIGPYLPQIIKKLEWLDRDQLIKHFISAEFNRFLSYYKDAEDLNVEIKRDRKGREGREGRGGREGREGRERRGPRERSAANFTRFHIDVGSKNRLAPVDVIGLIKDNSVDKGIEIGKIDILRNFSFFEVDSDHAKQLLKGFGRGANYKGKAVKIQIAKEKDDVR